MERSDKKRAIFLGTKQVFGIGEEGEQD